MTSDSVIECTSTIPTLIASQSCSIDGGSFFECFQPLDIVVLAGRTDTGLGRHTLTIISQDSAGQQSTDTVDFNVTSECHRIRDSGSTCDFHI